MGRHPILRCAAGTAASLLLAPYLAAQATFRVSVSSTGDSGDAFSGFPALSSNGRLVAFSSSASNLAAAPQSSQVLVHDRASGVTSLASVGAADGSVNFNPTLSGDGRRVAFESSVSIFGSNYRSLLLHDHLTGTTTQVYGSLGAPSFEPDLSADGLALAFVTPDALVPSDTNELGDIYVYHVQTGAFERVSVPAGGGEADAWCNRPAASEDGRFVAFDSEATNLVAGDTNARHDVFVRDRLAGTTTRVSVATTGGEANQTSWRASISGDGRLVAFESGASNLVPGDMNQRADVFVHDRQTGATARVSVDSGGQEADGNSGEAEISGSGRFVAFTSDATNLVAGDTNAAQDVFIHDFGSGSTSRISVGSTGVQGDSLSSAPALDHAGTTAAFQSHAATLVEGDANATWDVFVRELAACNPTVAAYCIAGTTSSGCVPAISGAGTPSGSSGAGFDIIVSAVEGQQPGLVIYGLSGSQAAPFGGGTSLLCVRLPVQRTSVQSSGGTLGVCDGSLSLDWNQYVAAHPSALGNPFGNGETVWAQAWFRDPGAAGSSALSDALWFQVCP